MVRRLRLLLLVVVVASSFLVVAPVSAGDPVCTITGTDGDDVLSGTADADVICGLAGNDTIDAGDGDDVVFGGTGSDVIHGGPGNDELAGNEDADELYGDAGDDWIGGGKGDDVIYGGDGADTVEGKAGADTIYGGQGDDNLAGNEDNDTVHGDEGNDTLGGGKGDDVIYGGDGADTVEGKTGADTIYGGLGDDNLAGNEDADIIYGDGGDDWLGGGKGPDEVHGGVGDDTLVGKKGDDLLLGGAGVDSADGSQGTDVCVAESEVSCEEDPSTPTAVTFTHPTDGVTVFHVETITVTVEPVGVEGTVELSVDGAVVGTAPIVDGSALLEWDTTTVEDGDVVLTAVAFDAAGDPATSAEVTVSVSNASTGAGRIETDFAQGAISVDEYVEWGIWSLTHPALLEDRYGSGPLFDGDDAMSDGLLFVSKWDQIDVATRQRVADYAAVQEVLLPPDPAPAGASAAQAATTWPECHDAVNVPIGVVFHKTFRCLHEVDLPGSPGETLFKVWYTVEGMDDPGFLDRVRAVLGGSVGWAETVADTDVNSDGVPDDIATLSGSLIESYDRYRNLSYDVPSLPIEVAVHETRGMVLPHLGLDDLWPVDSLDFQDSVVQVDRNSKLSYLPRHELFHKFQLEYLDLRDMEGDFYGVLWWMEATAEWAAHQVAQYLAYHATPPAPPLEADLYETRLDEFLSDPSGRIDEFNDDASSRRQYGAFILAEYLEERHGKGFIHDVWETIGAGDVTDMVGVIGSELGGAGSSWAAELPGFWRAAYLLASSDGTEPFTGTEWPGGPVTADTVWRPHLEANGLEGETDPLSLVLGLDAARPRRSRAPLTDGVEASDSAVVNGGGAAFFDLVPQPAGSQPLPDPGTLRVEVTADTNQGGVAAQLQRFTTYPTSCGTVPIALETSSSGMTGTAIIDVDPACPFATLIVVNADPNGTTRRFDWTATYETGPNLLSDPGFESGDYTTSWTTFTPAWIAGGFGIVDTPTHRGLHAAGIGRSEGECDPNPGGYEQDVTVTPGATYSGFVWFKRYRYGGADGLLQVTQPDGTVIAEDTLLAWDYEWHRLDVSFVAPSDTVKFRIGLIGDACETRYFVLDDAVLVEGTVGDLVNAGFDDGLDAWTVVGAADGTVSAVTVPDGVSAIQITPPADHQPIGVEQWFDAYDYNAASAHVKVVGAPAADVTLEIVRLDGTVVDDTTVQVSGSDYPGSWVTISDVFWVRDTEDVLGYRITTTGPGDVVVDWTLVGLTT